LPDINETERVAWVPLSDTIEMIARGEIVGGACVVALYRALSLVQ
jgi:ADP-ribose pyrophosphatase